MKTYIVVKNQKHGIHNWPEAPVEVAHLRAMHRHNFLFKTKIEVEHDDRALEFFTVQDFIQEELDKLPDNLKTSSCEQLAKAVIKMIHKKYGERNVMCNVSEDGQNSAIVEYTKDNFIENMLWCDNHGAMSVDSEQHVTCKKMSCLLHRITKS